MASQHQSSRNSNPWRVLDRASRFALAAALAVTLVACQDTGSTSNARASRMIPSDALALMSEKDTDAHMPMLIRAYKKEAEFEIWKMNREGRYVHLKTYPMCRWSGQLGPKVREGDRQVPEGFYTITPGQMNPNSAYYLSFNVGYPNAYDRAHDYTGGEIMVHGICSSAGCFSMTDEQIAEIYAIARESFGGGQRGIQMQSFPFRMTPENLAKHRFDPNIRFWKEIKEGSDQFDVTGHETKVAVCGKHYVFGQTPANANAHLEATAECPPLQEDPNLKVAVAEKQRRDDAQVAELVAKGVKPVRLVYADGGQNPQFANHVTELSRPEALETAPREIALDSRGKPLPAAVQVASAKADKAPVKPVTDTKSVDTVATIPVAKATPSAPVVDKPAATTVTAYATEPPAAPAAAEQPFYKRWLGIHAEEAKAQPTPLVVPVEPQPGDAPLPPRKKQAQTPQTSTVKPQASLDAKKSLKIVASENAPMTDGYKAYAPVDH